MKKHFVTFLSPGTFVSEQTQKPIDSWDVNIAMGMAHDITERHGATPYGFHFMTRERGEDDLDSKEVERSPTYYLGGTILTLAEIKDRNDPDDKILISNMEGNGYPRVIVNTNSWRFTAPLNDDDVVLNFESRKAVEAERESAEGADDERE